MFGSNIAPSSVKLLRKW